MVNLIRKTIFILIGFAFFSCGELRESPVIYFSNASPAPIKSIEATWARKNVLTLSELNPGDSRSQSFYISSNSDFFGFIIVSWVNAAGDKITKKFFFKENNLPDIGDFTNYHYVQIYLDQEDLEIVTSASPDPSGKTRKMEALLGQYRDQFTRANPGKASNSLISTHPKKDTSVPYWLNNSF
jgi:hypothetical protein